MGTINNLLMSFGKKLNHPFALVERPSHLKSDFVPISSIFLVLISIEDNGWQKHYFIEGYLVCIVLEFSKLDKSMRIRWGRGEKCLHDSCRKTSMSLWRCKRRRENNVKMDLREMRCEGVIEFSWLMLMPNGGGF
jgi:hypothetical protein